MAEGEDNVDEFVRWLDEPIENEIPSFMFPDSKRRSTVTPSGGKFLFSKPGGPNAGVGVGTTKPSGVGVQKSADAGAGKAQSTTANRNVDGRVENFPQDVKVGMGKTNTSSFPHPAGISPSDSNLSASERRTTTRFRFRPDHGQNLQPVTQSLYKSHGRGGCRNSSAFLEPGSSINRRVRLDGLDDEVLLCKPLQGINDAEPGTFSIKATPSGKSSEWPSGSPAEKRRQKENDDDDITKSLISEILSSNAVIDDEDDKIPIANIGDDDIWDWSSSDGVSDKSKYNENEKTSISNDVSELSSRTGEYKGNTSRQKPPAELPSSQIPKDKIINGSSDSRATHLEKNPKPVLSVRPLDRQPPVNPPLQPKKEKSVYDCKIFLGQPLVKQAKTYKIDSD